MRGRRLRDGENFLEEVSEAIRVWRWSWLRAVLDRFFWKFAPNSEEEATIWESS